MTFRFGFLDPGHFHAALVLRESSSRISNDVVVYADPGPELDAFTGMIDAFNSRASNPTRWNVTVKPSGLTQLADDPNIDVVVLAGRNAVKLEQIACLTKAGKQVFADKPWLTDAAQTDLLVSALGGPGFTMDIMTIRHEILSRLCHQVVHSPDVFGGFIPSSPSRAAIELGSIHHLYKQVNGRSLRRPAWYFDSRQQGDGIVDIQSHLIEQAMWFVVDENAVSSTDVKLLSARRWDTPVDLTLFKAITGASKFPSFVSHTVDSAGVLQYPCNGEIVWSLNGVVIQQSAQWGAREPDGAGDMHHVVLRGNRAQVHVRQGPETDYIAQVSLTPNEPGGIDDLYRRAQGALASWQRRFPGLGLNTGDGRISFDAPSDLDAGHESHFPLVRDHFLDIIERGAGDESLQSRISARYALIAAAHELALKQVTP